MSAPYDLLDSSLPELETVPVPDSTIDSVFSFPPVITVSCDDFGNLLFWHDLTAAYHLAPLGFRYRSI